MLDVIARYAPTVLILAALALVVFLAVRSLLRDRRSDKPTCGGDCSLCGGCAAMPPDEKKRKGEKP